MSSAPTFSSVSHQPGSPITMAASSSTKSEANSNTKNNNKGKLRRPLSAYNLYFRSEREVIRADVNQGNAPQDYSKHVEAALKRLKGKRGAAEFQAVASTIAARWKTLPASERSKYEKMAEAEMEEYKERKFEYHRTLVKECEMAARAGGKQTPTETLSSNSEATERTAPVQGTVQSHHQLFMAPQDSNPLATFPHAMTHPHLNAMNLNAPVSFAGLSFPQRDIPSVFNNNLFPTTPSSLGSPTRCLNQMNSSSYEEELSALRQEIQLRERLLVQQQIRHEEKMRRQMAAMAQDDQAWMDRQLALLRGVQNDSALFGDEAAMQLKKRAAMAAMVRASMRE